MIPALEATPEPMPFAHPILRVATPAAWVRGACASADILLIDHANCEKKAASTALSLMFAYAEDLDLTDKMSLLAREELRHYEQVAKLMKSLGVVPQRCRRAAMQSACGAWSPSSSRSARSIC